MAAKKLTLGPDEEAPHDSRASTPDYEVVEQPVLPERAGLPDPERGLIPGLFDDKIDIYPKYLLKMDADQAKALRDALTSFRTMLAVKRTKADHICKMVLS